MKFLRINSIEVFFVVTFPEPQIVPSKAPIPLVKVQLVEEASGRHAIALHTLAFKYFKKNI